MRADSNKNMAFLVGSLVPLLAAVWLWSSASSAFDAKTGGLTYVAAVFFAVIAACVLCLAPVIQQSASKSIRVLGRLPMSVLLFLGICIAELLGMSVIQGAYEHFGHMLPDWFERVCFAISILMSIAIPIY